MNSLKTLTAALFTLICFSAQSQALELRDVVLAMDANENPAVYTFPCSRYMDAVFCGNNLILEKKCRQTLKISKEGLSCVSQKGDIVQFALIDFKSEIADSTKGGVFSYGLKYSDRVELKALPTPNENIEYQVIVK